MLKELICSQYICQNVGAYYYAWKLGSLINNSTSPLNAQKNYCLLLPQLFPSSINHFLSGSEKSYNLIDNEWNKMALDTTIQLLNFSITRVADDCNGLHEFLCSHP